jgi:hypothetical protein
MTARETLEDPHAAIVVAITLIFAIVLPKAKNVMHVRRLAILPRYVDRLPKQHRLEIEFTTSPKRQKMTLITFLPCKTIQTIKFPLNAKS